MKITKKIISLFLVVLMLVTAMFPLTSCQKTDDHEHSYTESVVAPTCKDKGYHKYTCSCGDPYVGSEIPVDKAGHLYETTYVYPTVSDAGSRTSVCTICGDTNVIEINALSATLPQVSEVLAGLIGKISATLALTEGSELVFVTELNDDADSNG